MKDYLVNNIFLVFFLAGLTVAAPASPGFAQTQKKDLRFAALLKDNNGELVAAQNVEILARVLSPNGCILMAEIFQQVSIDKGFFKLGLGSGTATSQDNGLLFNELFDNVKTLSPLQCLNANGEITTGGYTPQERDTRILRLNFAIPSNTDSPLSMEADFEMEGEGLGLGTEYIDGKSIDDLVVVNPDKKLTQTNLNNLMSQVVLNKINILNSILEGNYLGNSATATTATTATTALKATEFASPPTGCGAYQYAMGIQTNGNLICTTISSSAAGTVSQVSTGTGLLGGPITATGSISVDVGTTDGKIVQVGVDGKLPALNASQLTNLQASQIPTLTVSKVSDFATQVNILADAKADSRITNYVTAAKGAANGLAYLDSTGRIPEALLPSNIYEALSIQTQQLQLSNNLTLPTGSVTFKAPATGFSSYSLIMPAALGSVNQVLSLTNVTGSVGSMIGTLGWTDLASSALPVVPVNKGGTNFAAAGTSNQLLGVNAAGTALEYKSITAGSGLSITPSGSDLILTATGSGGTVTSVTGSGPISVASNSTAPMVSFTGASTEGEALRWDNTSSVWTISPIYLKDLVKVGGGSPWPNSSCGSWSALTYNKTTESFTCQLITASSLSGSITADHIDGLGSLAGMDSITLSNAGQVTSELPLTKGGTGLNILMSGLSANNQILGGSGGSALELKTIYAGTGFSVSHGIGSVTFSATGTGGTISEITALTPFAVSNGTTTPVISLTAGAFDGETLRWNSSTTTWEKTKLLYTDLTRGDGSSPWPTVSCAAGEAIVWQSNKFICAALTPTAFSGTLSAATQIDGIGTLAGLDRVDLGTDKAGNILAIEHLPAFTGDFTSSAASNTLSFNITVPLAKGGTGLTSSGGENNVLMSDGSGWVSATVPLGSSSLGFQSITGSNFTITSGDENKFFAVSTVGGATLTLPNTGAVSPGFHVVVKRTGASPVVVETSNAKFMDGASSKTLQEKYSSFSIYNTGSAWLIQSHYGRKPALIVVSPAVLTGMDTTNPANGTCQNMVVSNVGQMTSSPLSFTASTGFSTSGCTDTCTGEGISGGDSCTIGVRILGTNTAGSMTGSLTAQATVGGNAATYLIGTVTGGP